MLFGRKINNYLTILSYFYNGLLRRTTPKLEDIAYNKIILKESINSVNYYIYSEEDNMSLIPTFIPPKIAQIKYWGNRSRSNVMKQVIRESLKLEKSIFYELNDVIITNNYLYCNNHRQELKEKSKYKDLFYTSSYDYSEYGVFAHNKFGLKFWGHWLMSELPLQYQFKDDSMFIGHSGREPFRDEHHWRNILKLPPIIKANKWFVKKLIISNPLSMDPITIKNWFSIRDQIHITTMLNKRVYIKRDTLGQERLLVNEEQLINTLIKIGFYILDISEKRGDEIISLLTGAEVVIGVEGSHMDPVLYTLKNNGILITLQPPGRVSLNTVTNSSICGIFSAIYICNFENSYFSFRINIDNFLSFFDRVVKKHNEMRNQIQTRTLILKEKLYGNNFI